MDEQVKVHLKPTPALSRRERELLYLYLLIYP
jgi:hypothetical protein